jgi:hypothetical protein
VSRCTACGYDVSPLQAGVRAAAEQGAFCDDIFYVAVPCGDVSYGVWAELYTMSQSV